MKLTVLAEKGIPEKSNNAQADIMIIKNQIDQLVYQLYNLTEEEIKIVEGE